MAFVHLHVHSEYSMLDGACRIAELPVRAAELGQDAIALTDHGNMFGAVAFYKACKKSGVRPIIGCEVYVAPRSRTDRDPSEKYHHLILLCANADGYRNLSKLVSLGWLEGMYSKPRVDDELLSRYHEGLIALSGCVMGRIPQYILNGDEASARQAALYYNELFGKGNYYLEIQDHGLPEEKKVLNGLKKLSAETGIPLAATNDAHYIRRSDSETQNILLCIQTGSTLEKGSPMAFPNDEFYLKSEEEMRRIFADCPQAVDNTADIAARCSFDFDFTQRHLPAYPLPEGQKANDVLKALAEEGLKQKKEKGELDLSAHTFDDYKFRMIYELMMIAKMGYSDYFLIVRDFIEAARSLGVTVGPGRGSGAGSLVAYLVGITEVDSIAYDLLFERFLNPERVSMPDFDTDFCDVGRDRVIDYVREKYGKDHVAQIAAFGTLGAKGAIHDVGRVMGFQPRQIDEISALIPYRPDMTLEKALERKELKKLYDENFSVRQLIDAAKRVEGIPRNITTHAAGVVITERPIVEYMPVTVSSGATLTQYDMNTVAELGLLKFDFLALRYLTIIENAEKTVRLTDPSFNVRKLPTDDEETYAMIARGDTAGLFQLESQGMTRLLTMLRPRNIGDLMLAIALYRPGPMESIPALIEARGGKKPEYKIPQLSEILDSTSGVIVYQEQVMQIFRRVAGYSFGRADIVRRAMAKKHESELQREREGFLEGAVNNGVDREDAAELFESMASFASYAFNKSHAAAYALVAYRTAYLKAHAPLAYFAALLTSVSGDTAKTAEYVEGLESRGYKLLPPDVNKSLSSFTPEPEGLRYGLLGIKSLGEGFINELIEERVRGGAFTDLESFLMRMRQKGAGKPQVLALIGSGAFDSFKTPRSRMTESIDGMFSYIAEKQRAEGDAQIDLFTAAGEKRQDGGFAYPEIDEYPLETLLQIEKDLTGMWFSGHPLEEFSLNRAELNADRIASLCAEAQSGKEGGNVSLCGMIRALSVKTSKAGSRFAVMTVEDESGDIEALIFEKVLERVSDFLNKDRAIYLRGRLTDLDREKPKVTVFELLPLIKNEDFLVLKGARGAVEKPAEADPSGEDHSGAGNKTQAAANPPYQSVPAADRQNKRQKLYIRLSGDERVARRVEALIDIFTGFTPCVYYDERSKSYRASGKSISATPYILEVLKSIAGKENVVLK